LLRKHSCYQEIWFSFPFFGCRAEKKPEVPGHLQSPFLGSTLQPRKEHRPRTTLPGHLPPPCPRAQPCLNSPGRVCLMWSSKFPAVEAGWHRCSSCGVTAGAVQQRWAFRRLLGAKTFLPLRLRANLPEIVTKVQFVSRNCVDGATRWQSYLERNKAQSGPQPCHEISPGG